MNDEEVDFADLGELGELGVDELDFGGNIGNNKETEESVDKKIKYVEENLWEKLERVGKKISFARDILAFGELYARSTCFLAQKSDRGCRADLFYFTDRRNSRISVH